MPVGHFKNVFAVTAYPERMRRDLVNVGRVATGLVIVLVVAIAIGFERNGCGPNFGGQVLRGSPSKL